MCTKTVALTIEASYIVGQVTGLILATSLATSTAFNVSADEPSTEQNLQSPYSNFITTLKSLCDSHPYILIGDTNHSSLEIVALTSNVEVLQAIKDCNRPLALERNFEENEGYRILKNSATDEEFAKHVKTVQQSLELKVTGEWNDETDSSISSTIAGWQDSFGWQKDQPGIFSYEFADIIEEKTPEAKDFLDALRYIKETSYYLDHYTLAMQYQDIQDGYADQAIYSAADYNGNTYHAQMAQYQHNQIFNAATIDLPLLHIDSRQQDLLEDPEVENLIHDLLYQDPATSKKELIYSGIKGGAKVNKDIEYRKIVNRLNILLKKSLSTSNLDIINNLKALNGKNSAVIKFGFGHMKQTHDFNEMLGSDQTAVIMLKHQPDQIISFYNSDSAGKLNFNSDDAPDYIYNIYDNTIVKIEAGQPSEQAYRSMINYTITYEEYQTAVSALPEDLKPYTLPYTEYDANPDNDQLPKKWWETDQRFQFPATDPK